MLPYLNPVPKTKRQLIEFGGVDYTEGAAEGEISASLNLSTDKSPCISQRKERGLQGVYVRPSALFSFDGLVVVDGTNLIYQGEVVGTVSPGAKQFAVVNTKLIIMPDKIYLDLTNKTIQSLDATVKAKPGTVTFAADSLTMDLDPLQGTGEGKYPYTVSSSPMVKTYTAVSWTAVEGWVKEGEQEKSTKDVLVGDILIPTRVQATGALVVPTKTETGWSGAENDEGIYFPVTSVVDDGLPEYKWDKYNCIVGSSYSQYYTLNFRSTGPFYAGPDGFTGNSSYSFNSYTGKYSVTGSIITVTNSGTIYSSGGGGTAIGDGYFDLFTADVKGPFYESYTTYSKGTTLLGSVYGASGSYPNNSHKVVDGTRYWFVNAGTTGFNGTVTIKYNVMHTVDTELFTSHFKEGDIVSVSGCTTIPGNNIENLQIKTVTDDTLTFETSPFEAGSEAAEVVVLRRVPDFAYICSNNNRLWGVEGQTIYGSALGDPTNFTLFEGISTDGYAVAVGTDGKFTGCCSYSGDVLFFKENVLYKLLGDYPGEYQLYPYDISGLQEGSHKSLRIINEVLYYKGKDGVYAYSGGVPSLISRKLGIGEHFNAVSGTDGIKYYISMQDREGKWSLHVYDTLRGLWLREDDTQVSDFAYQDGSLYFLDADNSRVFRTDRNNEGDTEIIEWSAELAPFTEISVLRKAYSKLYLRAEVKKGSYLQVETATDNNAFKVAYASRFDMAKTITVPLIPTRCDTFRVRLSGKGSCLIRSLVREFAVGSEKS